MDKATKAVKIITCNAGEGQNGIADVHNHLGDDIRSRCPIQFMCHEHPGKGAGNLVCSDVDLLVWNLRFDDSLHLGHPFSETGWFWLKVSC